MSFTFSSFEEDLLLWVLVKCLFDETFYICIESTEFLFGIYTCCSVKISRKVFPCFNKQFCWNVLYTKHINDNLNPLLNNIGSTSLFFTKQDVNKSWMNMKRKGEITLTENICVFWHMYEFKLEHNKLIACKQAKGEWREKRARF